MVLLAGDSIVDWVITKKEVQPTVGGAGNIVRGLQQRGHDVEFLTVYNPMLYPMSYVLNMHPNCLMDFNHRNVFVRDYDAQVFQRFRENLKTSVLDVKNAMAVICHEDSIIRHFEAFYADVRDTSVRGICDILRMSSTDDTAAIMEKITHQIAIITYQDKVEVKGLDHNQPDTWTTIQYPAVRAIDDIGAGDSFDVGFLDYVLSENFTYTQLKQAVDRGIQVAQKKVTTIGVFL